MSRAKIVEVVTGRTMAEIIAARDRAESDMVELRMDYVGHIDVAGALAGRSRPVIFTCRARWEGGHFSGSEEDRMRILSEAITGGAEYVDVEWRADRRVLPKGRPGQIVLSHHDFGGMPADLDSRVRAMLAEQPDVLKIAVTTERLRDCLTLRQVMDHEVPRVVIGMGPAGQLTRLAPVQFGSLWTYGGQATPGQTAPGQTTATELRDCYRVSVQDERTVIYGIGGHPLGHSASPAMHNAAFAALGINAVYLPFETSDIDELLDVIRGFGVQGLSITAPLKTEAFARVGAVDRVGQATRSINTIRRVTAGYEGRNYDVNGFLDPFVTRGFTLVGKRAVVLGGGGSARTAAYALHAQGAQVAVSARRTDAAAALSLELGVGMTPFPPALGWDLLVNTTPVGTWPTTEVSPLARDRLAGGLVYDLIYNPEDTQLIRWAREAGSGTIGGLEMLVGQAAHQFAWWTDRAAPLDVMTEAARAFIRRDRELS